MKKKNADIHRLEKKHISRRSFLKVGALALGGCMFPKLLLAAIEVPQAAERSLSLYNLHTGESLNTAYWLNGAYLPEALTEINHILRDHRTEEIKPIDTGLLDLLHTIHKTTESKEMLHIISGYRSPATNNKLRGTSSGIARNSLHLEGKAADIRLPRYDLSSLKKVAVALRGGGVGYYPGSDFIHIDIGRVRYW